jgi:hypothetical protein
MGRRRQNNLGLPPHMHLKHGAYYFVGKDKKWIRLSDDKAMALSKWAELEGETPIPKDEPKPIKGSVAELIMRYMLEVAPRKAKSTYQGNLLEAENLKKVFGKMHTHSVLPTHIAQYLDNRGIKSKVRANREISLLSHIYSMGMRWGVVNVNPCIGVAKHKEVGRSRYIMDSEFEAVKNMAGDLISTVMDFAYITALRKGDILRLKLDQITNEGIWIKQSKTGAKNKGMDAQTLAGHSSAAMTEHYIKQREFIKVQPLK